MNDPEISEINDIDEIITEFERIKEKLRLIKHKSDRKRFLATAQYIHQVLSKYCKDLNSLSFRADDFEKKYPRQSHNYLPSDRIKTFPDYLVLSSKNSHLKKDQQKLSEICKNLFNTNNSPKDYAIMLCLLSEKGFILILNKQRTLFYIAWYKFIERDAPPNKNFCSINKYIDDKASGFVFKDESDGDYRSMKNAFFTLLLKMNF
jgi:hypothetical protein